jgi:DNA-binding PadR family transcriptional regulator
MPQVTKADYSALSSLERDTLVAVGLTGGKPSGHDIWQTLIDHRPGSQRNSSFYNALESVVDAGLVEKRENPDDGRANQYSLTSDGEAALQNQADTINDAL